MRIAGLIAEKGMRALHAMHQEPTGTPRVWVVLAGETETEIWGRGDHGFEVIAIARPAEDISSFIEKLSEWLLAARDQDALDRIVLIASPKTLRTFRNSMPIDVLACITAEIPKDFTGTTAEERKQALDKMICL